MDHFKARGDAVVCSLVNQADDYGCMALHFAAAGGRSPAQQEPWCMAAVLPYVEDVNVVDNAGFTALHIAAQNGYTAIVRCLLGHPACDLKM